MTGLAVRIDRKAYAAGAATIIAGLEFKLREGEFAAIVGPSGAGKTTLLKLVAGLDGDFAGSIERPAGARLGYVFQEPRLLPWLTVEQNLRLVQPTLDAARIAEGLARIGLAGHERSLPLRLSGGMQRRVSLLRAFLVEPQLLLLDEPFVSLDAPTAASLHAALVDLRRDLRPTTLMVTHDLREALALADRVLFVGRAPARVILDHRVELSPGRRHDDAEVAAAQAALLARHPELLSGVVATPPSSEAPA